MDGVSISTVHGDGVEGGFFLLLAGELSRLKEHSRLLSLPWRSIAKYKAHPPTPPFSSSTYLTEKLCVCRPGDRFTELCECLFSSCWVWSGAGAQVFLLMDSNQNPRRLLNSFHLTFCSSGARQTDWSFALPYDAAACRTLFQKVTLLTPKSPPTSTRRTQLAPPR